jgi:hypothetical protein
MKVPRNFARPCDRHLKDVSHIAVAGCCSNGSHGSPECERGQGYGLRIRHLRRTLTKLLSEHAVVDSVGTASRLVNQLFVA